MAGKMVWEKVVMFDVILTCIYKIKIMTYIRFRLPFEIRKALLRSWYGNRLFFSDLLPLKLYSLVMLGGQPLVTIPARLFHRFLSLI